MFEESRIYGSDYPLYRDPSFTFEVLTIKVERLKDVTNGAGGATEQLLYSDLMLLGNGIKEHLGMLDDETVEFEVFRMKGKGSGEEGALVGKGAVGFSQAALMMNGGPASNTTDVRW